MSIHATISTNHEPGARARDGWTSLRKNRHPRVASSSGLPTSILDGKSLPLSWIVKIGEKRVNSKLGCLGCFFSLKNAPSRPPDSNRAPKRIPTAAATHSNQHNPYNRNKVAKLTLCAAASAASFTAPRVPPHASLPRSPGANAQPARRGLSGDCIDGQAGEYRTFFEQMRFRFEPNRCTVRTGGPLI